MNNYNKEIGDGRYWPGTKMTYSCDDGYSLGSSGLRVRTCQSNGTWDGSPKYCWSKYLQYLLFLFTTSQTIIFFSVTNKNVTNVQI